MIDPTNSNALDDELDDLIKNRAQNVFNSINLLGTLADDGNNLKPSEILSADRVINSYDAAGGGVGGRLLGREFDDSLSGFKPSPKAQNAFDRNLAVSTTPDPQKQPEMSGSISSTQTETQTINVNVPNLTPPAA